MVEIDPKDAFVHVVYEYRCLVRAEYAFRECARDKTVNVEVPEIGTVARNAVLSKARSIVDFYTKNPRDTDITLKEYYSSSLGSTDPRLFNKLETIRASMEVHDIHLTVWRDPQYRADHNSDLREQERQRIDWDKEQARIVDGLLEALKATSSSLSAAWEKAFIHLYDTCAVVLRSGGNWASDLTGPETIVPYLDGLGL